MEHCSSVFMVKMKHCIKDLATWLPVFTLTRAKNNGGNTDFFLETCCILFRKKIFLCFLQEQKKTLWVPFFTKEIKAPMDFSHAFCKSPSHRKYMWSIHGSVKVTEESITSAADFSLILSMISAYVFSNHRTHVLQLLNVNAV